MTSPTPAPRPSGGRLITRPAPALLCPNCRERIGFSYPDCPACYAAVERIWIADWSALIESVDGAAVGGESDEPTVAEEVLRRPELYPWTIVDIALTKLRCPDCGRELAGGPPDCSSCRMAFDNLWAYDVEAQYQRRMTRNEHALRVGRHVLRHPERHSEASVFGWRVMFPLLLAGDEPPSTRQAQIIRARINDGWRGRLAPGWVIEA